MKLSIIAAIANNRAIGNKNKLIYWLPNDLKRFKSLTTGNTIIMGRKTYESLPNGALPNRRNIVLTRAAQDGVNQSKFYPNCEVYSSLQKALEQCENEASVYIIGGAMLYAEALPLANRLCLTIVDDIPSEADAFFPQFGDEWRVVSDIPYPIDEKHKYRYRFVDYEKK